MAIAVKTNVPGLIAVEDLRRVNIQLSKTMKKLQTGLKIPDASYDPTALVVSNILTRRLNTLALANESLTRGASMMDTIEAAIADIVDRLTAMKQAAERVVAGEAVGLEAQATANELYADIRRIVRETRFGDTALLRGGLGNTVLYASTTDDPLLGSITIADIDVTGVNLTGYASLAYAQTTTLGNLVYASDYLPTFFASLTGLPNAGSAFIAISINFGIASASLWIGGQNAFNEAIAFATGLAGGNLITGPQVLDFQNLGLRVNLRQLNWGPGVNGLMTIGIDRNEAKFLAGSNASAFGDYYKFELPNLEPENLLGLGADQQAFTVDLANAAATAVQFIESAIRYVEGIRTRVGVLKQGFDTQKTKVSDVIIGTEAYRSQIRDAELDKEAIILTSQQVIQQSAIAMIAQARLQPQLALQFFT